MFPNLLLSMSVALVLSTMVFSSAANRIGVRISVNGMSTDCKDAVIQYNKAAVGEILYVLVKEQNCNGTVPLLCEGTDCSNMMNFLESSAKVNLEQYTFVTDTSSKQNIQRLNSKYMTYGVTGTYRRPEVNGVRESVGRRHFLGHLLVNGQYKDYLQNFRTSCLQDIDNCLKTRLYEDISTMFETL